MASTKEICKDVLDKDKAFPGAAFNSSDWFNEEKSSIFSNQWLCVALSDDIKEIGQLNPVSIFNEQLILLRDKNGKARALENVCSHRGAILVREKKCRKIITCPYHCWAYDLDGKLVRTPHVAGNDKHCSEYIKTEDYGLKEYACVEWGVFVFINFTESSDTFAEYIRPMEERIDMRVFDLLRRDQETTLDVEVNANWKLIVENFVESYHVPSVHPALQSVNPMSNHYQILGGNCYIGQGGESFSGDRVVGELPMHPYIKSASHYEAFYLFPNLIFVIAANFMNIILIKPENEKKTHERIELFVVGDEAVDAKYQSCRKVIREFLYQVNDEDVDIVESVQRGRMSGGFSGGVFALGQEDTSLHFQKLVACHLLEGEGVARLSELPVQDIYHDTGV